MKYSHFFIGKSIRFKLLFYFLFLILFPIVTLGLFGNMIYSSFIEDQTNTHTVQMIDKVKKNVEFYISDMESIIQYLSDEPAVIGFLKDKVNKNEKTEAEIKRMLKSFANIHQEIAGMMIVNKDGLYVSNEMQKISRDPLTGESWYMQSTLSPYNVQLFSRPIGRNIETQFKYSADDVVSITKAVLDPDTSECIGVILIDMKLDLIKKAMEDIKFGKDGFLFIMDSTGEIVYAPVNPIVYRVNKQWLKDSDSGSVIKNIKGNDYHIMYNSSSYTKWKTIGIFSFTEVLKVVAQTRNYTFIIGIVTLILAVTAALFFTSSIDKPLRKLRSLMKKAEEGDLNVEFNSKYNDEIGQLGNSFNNMIGEIRKLIKMVYKEQKSKREAELKTLQAQIKPHFLYNTLDTIQWLAQSHGANDIVEIVSALTNLFRIGISKGKELISVGEELEHVKSYLVIQKARYEDKLEYEIYCEEGITDCSVIKLILQPIVENAIYHGIKARRGSGKLTISIKRAEDKLILSVSDNGAGIPPEKLKDIVDILEGRQEGGHNIGYGIFNVNERIRLTYGRDFGLKLSSVYGEGTTVEIWHPIIER